MNDISTARLLRVFTFNCQCTGACEGSSHELGSQSWAYKLCIERVCVCVCESNSVPKRSKI